MLLQARAAEVGGDTAGAERAYSGMLANEDTEVLGRKAAAGDDGEWKEF